VFVHGTHVASTSAGTGAASGGAEAWRRARRPARHRQYLLTNRVLPSDHCYRRHGVAAVDVTLKIIRMILAQPDHDGTDPLSARSRAHAQTGSLFVIAAVNPVRRPPSARRCGPGRRADVARLDGSTSLALLRQGPACPTRP